MIWDLDWFFPNEVAKMSCFACYMDVVGKALEQRGVSADEFSQIRQNVPNVACEDQYVGIVKSWENWREDFTKRLSVRDRLGGRCVVYVLESPNVAEYSRNETNQWRSNGPASGCTGCRLRRYWNEVCKMRFDGCQLILCNVVQFQCSLESCLELVDGVKLKGIKDVVFRHCIKDETGCFWTSFAKRIKKIVRLCDNNVDYVYACTAGIGKSSRKKIGQFLMNATSGKVYETTHPSSWQWKSKRDFDLMDLS